MSDDELDEEMKATTKKMVISIARSVNLGNGEYYHMKLREEVDVAGKDLDKVADYRRRHARSLRETIREEVKELRKEGRA